MKQVGKPLLFFDQPAHRQHLLRSEPSWTGREEKIDIHCVVHHDCISTETSGSVQPGAGLTHQVSGLLEGPPLCGFLPIHEGRAMIGADNGNGRLTHDNVESGCPDFLVVEDIDAIFTQRFLQGISIPSICDTVAQLRSILQATKPPEKRVHSTQPERQR
jgi:hypothetical protein